MGVRLFGTRRLDEKRLLHIISHDRQDSKDVRKTTRQPTLTSQPRMFVVWRRMCWILREKSVPKQLDETYSRLTSEEETVGSEAKAEQISEEPQLKFSGFFWVSSVGFSGLWQFTALGVCRRMER